MGLQVIVGCPMDTERIPCLVGLICTGYEDNILLSHDTICIWLGRAPEFPEFLIPIIKNWHPSHIFRNIIPLLKKCGLSDKQARKIIVDNPARLFS
jgi:phosphotriesterase-related protein